MEYIDASYASVLEPKLLGIYERELSDVISQLMRTPFEQVIDIGAAEGYYAVGFAKYHSTCKRVIAFEAATEGRKNLAELAKKNGVEDRLVVLGECSPNDLLEYLDSPSTLVICDIEGGEVSVLDPQAAPCLRRATILVELHKRNYPDVEQLLRDRFRDSHIIQAIQQEDRTVLDFPFWGLLMPFCPSDYLMNCVSEFRQPWEERMTWFFMTPSALKSEVG